MYKRHIIQELKKWSKNPHRKPLILRGARQVGKTSIIHELGKAYSTFLTLNMELKADRDLFNQNLSIDDLIAAIHFHLKQPAQPEGKTLLFIDEIQYEPLAASLLRYFYEQRNDIHVVAAGSLLEVLIDQHISFPVGRVEYLFMYPMTFSEYLMAADETEALQLLQQIPIPHFAHDKLLKLFHQYILVGGMPEAINRYLENKDILACNSVYQNLMIAFMDDVEKYASNKIMAQTIRHAIAYAPFATGERIHFHGFGNSNYGSREMGEALRTLEKAFILKLIYPTTESTLPAPCNYKKSPRLQFLDIGIINFIAGLQQHYFSLQDLNTVHKGKIIESATGQLLLANNIFPLQQLKFWVRDKPQSNAEVDFVFPFKQYLIPIEVKSGKTGTLRSLMQYMGVTNHTTAIRFYNGKTQVDTIKTTTGKSFTLHNLPYYAIETLENYLKMSTTTCHN